MMEIDYVVMDPTGNITILVETPVPEASQPFAAEQLMELEPEAEQVGFLSPGVLRMAGGEFCGNASMSAAVYELIQRNAAGPEEILLRVSGAAKPVRVLVEAEGASGFRGTVEMPRPRRIREVRLPLPDERGTGYSGTGPEFSLPVVEFEGISHIIIETKEEKPAGEPHSEMMILKKAETLAPLWCRELGAEALGLMFLDEAAGTMKPLVYVPAAGTMVWENSCASGTTAAGAFLAERQRRKSGKQEEVRRSLRQPGGILQITVKKDGGLFLGGNVRLRKKGRAALRIPG